MPALYETLGHAKWQDIRKAVGAPPMPALTGTKKVSLTKKPVSAK